MQLVVLEAWRSIMATAEDVKACPTKWVTLRYFVWIKHER